MHRILLRFENLQQITGSEELSVILLTDSARQRVLTVVCDAEMTHQLLIRLHGRSEHTRTMLPETLLQFMPSRYEMMIVGIYDGQYQVMLMDVENGNSVRIRTSDAVLLSIISHIPLYIEERLMARQSVPFDEHATGVSVPINSMDTQRLKVALRNAVEEENYELASQIRDEINRRRPQSKSSKPSSTP